jgi:hypothetical protein
MTIQQESRNTALVQLTALDESGDYTQALQMIDAQGLQNHLEEQPDVVLLAGMLAAGKAETSREIPSAQCVLYLLPSCPARFAAGGHRNGSGRRCVNEAGTVYTGRGRPVNASGNCVTLGRRAAASEGMGKKLGQNLRKVGGQCPGIRRIVLIGSNGSRHIRERKAKLRGV